MHGKAPYSNDFLDAGVLSRSVSIVKGDLVFYWMGSCLFIESFEENDLLSTCLWIPKYVDVVVCPRFF